MRGKPAPTPQAPEDGPRAALGKLSQLLAEASRLAVTAAAQVAEADPGRVAAVLAEAEVARRSAEAHAAADLVAVRRQAERETAVVQAACQAQEEAAREPAAAAIARAERAETALDAERAERRALTDRLTAVPAQPRTRNRAAASPQKDKQHREDAHP